MFFPNKILSLSEMWPDHAGSHYSDLKKFIKKILK